MMAKRRTSAFLTKVPQAPEGLSEKARAHYDWIVPMLVEAGVLMPIDMPIVAAACDLYADYQNAKTLADKKAAISAYDKLMSRYNPRRLAGAAEDGGRADAISKAFD